MPCAIALLLTLLACPPQSKDSAPEDSAPPADGDGAMFPTGNVVFDDELYVYYGGADTVCCAATAPVRDLLDYVLTFRE